MNGLAKKTQLRLPQTRGQWDDRPDSFPKRTSIYI